MKLRPVTVRWNIDPDQSVSDVYDPEVPGTYVFRAEVKSSRLVPGDGAEMPEITVTVDAEAGVIPAGTTLSVLPDTSKGEVSVRFSRLDMTAIKKGEERVAQCH
ncbi:hypothetical protein ACTQ56_12565 [[Clostridium] aminophilum]|uniref:hypothetical protein n=1 Tax=[Clostridium] aminophilum TaxID=1526 RepID=UPI003F94C2D3